MIQIENYDLPIAVAQKIITGTKSEDVCACDMFELEEIKEIADYLMVYYNAHKEGD